MIVKYKLLGYIFLLRENNMDMFYFILIFGLYCLKSNFKYSVFDKVLYRENKDCYVLFNI